MVLDHFRDQGKKYVAAVTGKNGVAVGSSFVPEPLQHWLSLWHYCCGKSLRIRIPRSSFWSSQARVRVSARIHELLRRNRILTIPR
mgnify:CR=1 FL=1